MCFFILLIYGFKNFGFENNLDISSSGRDYLRRPLLIIFIVVLCFDLLFTILNKPDNSYENKDVKFEGVIKDRVEKPKYNQYKVGDFLVNDYQRKSNLTIGDRVIVQGKFKSLDKMKFDDFDYGRYVKSTGYKGIIYIKSYKKIGCNKVYKYLGNVKYNVRDISRYLYKDYSNFINSILLGDTSGLDDEEKNMFKVTGTSHIIAISGLHTGILCTIIGVVVGGINKFYKVTIVLFIMSLFSVMVGSSPSVIRAVLFTIILYTSIFIDRKRDAISSLAFIGIIMILENPFIIYNVSFQLSFSSTLSIIYFEPFFYKVFKIRIISMTISSNILTIPIVYYTFGGIPLISIIGNAVVVPFIAAIMYLSLVSILIYRLILFSKLISFFNLVIIKSIYWMLGKLGEFRYSYIEIDTRNLYIVLIYYIFVITYMVLREIKIMREQENGLQGYYKEY